MYEPDLTSRNLVNLQAAVFMMSLKMKKLA